MMYLSATSEFFRLQGQDSVMLDFWNNKSSSSSSSSLSLLSLSAIGNAGLLITIKCWVRGGSNILCNKKYFFYWQGRLWSLITLQCQLSNFIIGHNRSISTVTIFSDLSWACPRCCLRTTISNKVLQRTSSPLPEVVNPTVREKSNLELI